MINPQSKVANKILADSTLQQTTSIDNAQIEVPQAFWDIWLEHYSEGYIYKKNGQWLTARFEGIPGKTYKTRMTITEKGKVMYDVYLSEETLKREWLKWAASIGKRFSGLTSYLMLDVDIKESPYHPENDLCAWGQLIETLDCMGLKGRVIIRSSSSRGIHIYMPLPHEVKSWQTAKYVCDRLLEFGFTIKHGWLELFPDVKKRNNRYAGHRLPLQPGSGSFILHPESLKLVSNSTQVFVEDWEAAKLKNNLPDWLKPKTNNKPKGNEDTAEPSKQASITSSASKSKAWVRPIFTSSSQANDHLIAMANIGHWQEGKKNRKDLAKWLREEFPKLKGYPEFASEDTKMRVEEGNWCDEIAESHFKWCKNNNLKKRVEDEGYHVGKANDSKERIKATVEEISLRGLEFESLSKNKKKKVLQEIGKELFGEGFSNRTLTKYEDIWYSNNTHTILIKGKDGSYLDTQDFEGGTQPFKQEENSRKTNLETRQANTIATKSYPYRQRLAS